MAFFGPTDLICRYGFPLARSTATLSTFSLDHRDSPVLFKGPTVGALAHKREGIAFPDQNVTLLAHPPQNERHDTTQEAKYNIAVPSIPWNQSDNPGTYQTKPSIQKRIRESSLQAPEGTSILALFEVLDCQPASTDGLVLASGVRLAGNGRASAACEIAEEAESFDVFFGRLLEAGVVFTCDQSRAEGLPEMFIVLD
jgi:hypothetical protein